MNKDWENLDQPGCAFFGTVSRATAHDIRNKLAVIHQKAGLLEDLAMMAGKGLPLDPGKLNELAKAVINEVKQAEKIVKNLSYFGHCFENSTQTADLFETFERVLKISAKSKTGNKVGKVTAPDRQITLSTHPFLLAHLLHHGILYACNTSKDSGPEISFLEEKDGAGINFSNMEKPSPDDFLKSLGKSGKALMENLNATLVQNSTDSISIIIKDIPVI